MKNTAAFILLSICLIPSILFSEPAQKIDIDFKGYYKNLFVLSETFDNEDYNADVNRFRLDIDCRFSENLAAKFILDDEILFGNYLRTEEFKLLKELPSTTYFDLDKEIIDGKDLYWLASIFRFYFVLETENIELKVGRQRIAWGTGRLWNPTDLFNPYSPLQIEQDERTGTDAILFQYTFTDVSDLTIAYAPRDDPNEADEAIKFKTTVGEYDLSFMAGRFKKDEVIAFDYSGYIADGGFRGETTYTFAEDRDDYPRFVIGYDYNFKNGIYLLFEYFYNGGNISTETLTIEELLNETIRESGIVTRNRNFVGIEIGYDITPLLRMENICIYDIDGKSFFNNFDLLYSLTDNSNLGAGLQLFSGVEDSEFGPIPNVYYLQYQLFF